MRDDIGHYLGWQNISDGLNPLGNDGSPRDSKIARYKDLVAIFDKYNIGYANWNYKSGSFGIVDTNMKPDTTMVNILTGKK